jgi:hypothetical protein
VSFLDPLNDLEGLEAYRTNVDMLGGRTLLGRLLFQDASIVLHSIEDIDDRTLQTRWTLQVRFKILPWRPLAQFSGISIYDLGADGRVLRQTDYWDSINLSEGRYTSVPKLLGATDFIKQILPRPLRGVRNALPFKLLRRAASYEVREYPALMAVEGARKDIDAYLSGENAQGSAVSALPLCQRTVPQTLPCTRRILCVSESSTTSLPTPLHPELAVIVMLKQTVAVSILESITAAAIHSVNDESVLSLRRRCLSDGLRTTEAAYITQHTLLPAVQELWVPLAQHLWDKE